MILQSNWMLSVRVPALLANTTSIGTSEIVDSRDPPGHHIGDECGHVATHQLKPPLASLELVHAFMDMLKLHNRIAANWTRG